MYQQKQLRKQLGDGYRFCQRLSSGEAKRLLSQVDGGNHFQVAASLTAGVVKLEAVVYWNNGRYALGYDLMVKDSPDSPDWICYESLAEEVRYSVRNGWQDIKKAIHYLQMAAEDGNSFGEYQLGKLYYFGNGVRADAEKGLEYLRASAEHGNQYAAILLQTIQHQQTWGAASCAASLIAQLGRIFQEREQNQNQCQKPRMDRKQKREIAEKKQAMGLRG